MSLRPGLACGTIAGNWLPRMPPAPFRARLRKLHAISFAHLAAVGDRIRHPSRGAIRAISSSGILKWLWILVASAKSLCQ